MSDAFADMLKEQFRHAWSNRFRLGALGSQDIESMISEIVRQHGYVATARAETVRAGMALVAAQTEITTLLERGLNEEYQPLRDEVDRLRRWKAEATEVLTEWEAAYDVLHEAGRPAPLGMRKSRHVAGYLKIAIDREAQS